MFLVVLGPKIILDNGGFYLCSCSCYAGLKMKKGKKG
jgi:predicted nucleic acid-binding Zn finger protein